MKVVYGVILKAGDLLLSDDGESMVEILDNGKSKDWNYNYRWIFLHGRYENEGIPTGGQTSIYGVEGWTRLN